MYIEINGKRYNTNHIIKYYIEKSISNIGNTSVVIDLVTGREFIYFDTEDLAKAFTQKIDRTLGGVKEIV